MVRYDEEIEQMDQQIYETRIEKEKLSTELEQEQNEYERRAKAMRDWTEQKENIRQQMIYLRIMTRAVIKIQVRTFENHCITLKMMLCWVLELVEENFGY